MPEKWTCPYCDRACTIGDADIREITNRNWINQKYGTYIGTIYVIVCPNPECERQIVIVRLWEFSENRLNSKGTLLLERQVIPESSARMFPDYIPRALRDDYAEACLIKEKSPKASATLCRRCLQGIIRDFWNVRKKRLVDEIEGIKDKVDSSTWAAIDAVRHVGNIGAHMGEDVNLIIDVDSNEAELLIGLIETLFQEWYIAKHDREERMKALVKVAEAKKDAKKGPAPLAPGEASTGTD